MEKRKKSRDPFKVTKQHRHSYTEGSLCPPEPVPGEKLEVEKWVWLNSGQRVRVKREREAVSGGFVDLVAPDASIFWVWLDDGRGRIALHEDDKVSVWYEDNQASSTPNTLSSQVEDQLG